MKNILDEAFPDRDNDPSNYVLMQSIPDLFIIYYKPTNNYLHSHPNRDLFYKMRDYLLSQNVEVFEGGMRDLHEKIWGGEDAEKVDDSS